MSNTEVAHTLRGLLGKAVTSSPSDLRSVLSAAYDAGQAEIQPTESEVSAAAASWESAARRWSQTRSQISGIVTDLPHSWTGASASACQTALTSYSAAAATPERGAGDLAGALLRLNVALEDPRARRDAELRNLSALMLGTGKDIPADLAGVITRLAAAYEAADAAANRAATWVHDAAHDLAFPAKASSMALSPFLRAVTPASPMPRTIKKPGAGVRRTPARKPVARSTSPGKAPARPKRQAGNATGGVSRRHSTRTRSKHPVPVAPRRRNVARPNAARPKTPPVPSSVSGTRARVIAIARRYTGIPYVWGGTTPRGFDCSGLTQYVYRQVGVNLPRLAEAQRYAGRVVSRSQARPGDLVCMAHHVGIYLGNGMMFDAPRTGKTVGARRIWTDNYTLVRVLR